MTKLEAFIQNNDVKPAQLADLTGISPQHLYRLRRGKAEPTRPFMIWLTLGCRRLVQREVLVTELFDLSE